MECEVIQLEPRFLSGACMSRANSYAHADKSIRQNICLLSVISSHVKMIGSKCFAATATLIEEFNSACSKFHLKTISRSTFFTIQSRLIAQNLINVELNHNIKKGKHDRKISVVPRTLKTKFNDIFQLAYQRSNALINRKLDSARSQGDNHDKRSNGAASEQIVKSKNWTIRTNNKSKDLKEKKERSKTPHSDFYVSRFKSDADLAYQLEQAARNGSISGSGAKKLIALRAKHNVHVPKQFLKFLQYRIFNYSSKPKTSSNSLKSTTGRSSLSEHNRNGLSPTQAQAPLEQQKPARSNLMTNELIQQGKNLRDRIKSKINRKINVKS